MLKMCSSLALSIVRKQRGANIRIVGTKPQILAVLGVLTRDFTWQSNKHFYPRIDEPGFYSYYLEDFQPVVIPSQNLASEGFQSVSGTDQP
jgi:hypothetical protein